MFSKLLKKMSARSSPKPAKQDKSLEKLSVVWITGPSASGKSTLGELGQRTFASLGAYFVREDPEHYTQTGASVNVKPLGQISAHNKKSGISKETILVFILVDTPSTRERVLGAVMLRDRVTTIGPFLLKKAMEEFFSSRLPDLRSALEKTKSNVVELKGSLFDCLLTMVKETLKAYKIVLPDELILSASKKVLQDYRFPIKVSGWVGCGSKSLDRLAQCILPPNEIFIECRTCIQVLVDGTTVYVIDEEQSQSLRDREVSVVGLQSVKLPQWVVDFLQKMEKKCLESNIPFVAKQFEGQTQSINNPDGDCDLKKIANIGALPTQTDKFFNPRPLLKDVLPGVVFQTIQEPVVALKVFESKQGVFVWAELSKGRHLSLFASVVQIESSVCLSPHEMCPSIAQQKDSESAAAASSTD